MNVDYIKRKQKSVSMLLLGICAVLIVLLLIKVTVFSASSGNAQMLVENALVKSEPDTQKLENQLTESRKIAEDLKKKNLFVPPAEKQIPISAVSGIMGNEVLINERWYRLGDMVGDAKIVAIDPTEIKIEWNNSQRSFAPIDAPLPAITRAAGRGTEVASAATSERARPEVVQVQVDVRGSSQRGGGGFGNLSDQQMTQMRDQFRQMRSQMDQGFGGRSGGSSGGGGRGGGGGGGGGRGGRGG